MAAAFEALKLEVEALKAVTEGMKALNARRSLLDQSPGYVDEHFEEHAAKMIMLAKRMREEI